MTDHQIAARIVYCMAASAVAVVLIAIAMLSGDLGWVAVALLPALTGLVAVGSILRDLRKQHP